VTDKRPMGHSIYCASSASRGKNATQRANTEYEKLQLLKSNSPQIYWNITQNFLL